LDACVRARKRAVRGLDGGAAAWGTCCAGSPPAKRRAAPMKSTIGRPRRLTDQEVAIILAWHEQILALKALRATIKTQRQLACELGVAPSTIAHVIACRGQFKQASPGDSHTP